MPSLFPFHLHVCLCLLPLLVSAVDIGDEISFRLELLKHQPCLHSTKSKWQKKIEFEGGNERNGPKLEAVAGTGNCFSIGGKVQVYEDITEELSIFVEIRNSANRRQVPETCQKQGENFDDIAVEAQLLLDGKPVKCTDGLTKGTYSNMKLQFCLPKIEEVLKSQGLSKEAFLQLLQNDNGNTLKATGLFATVYLFDTDVSKLMQTQSRVLAVYRKTKKSLFKNEQLPPEVYWSLPFNQMIANHQAYVACHKIYANLKIFKQ